LPIISGIHYEVTNSSNPFPTFVFDQSTSIYLSDYGMIQKTNAVKASKAAGHTVTAETDK